MGKLISFELMFMVKAIAQGIETAAAYDMLKMFRVLVRHNNMTIGTEDFIFANAAGIFAFAMIYSCNDGIIRGFAISFLVLGICIYNITIGRITVKIFTKFINIAAGVLKNIRKKVKIKRVKRTDERK